MNTHVFIGQREDRAHPRNVSYTIQVSYLIPLPYDSLTTTKFACKHIANLYNQLRKGLLLESTSGCAQTCGKCEYASIFANVHWPVSRRPTYKTSPYTIHEKKRWKLVAQIHAWLRAGLHQACKQYSRSSCPLIFPSLSKLACTHVWFRIVFTQSQALCVWKCI